MVGTVDSVAMRGVFSIQCVLYREAPLYIVGVEEMKPALFCTYYNAMKGKAHKLAHMHTLHIVIITI